MAHPRSSHSASDAAAAATAAKSTAFATTVSSSSASVAASAAAPPAAASSAPTSHVGAPPAPQLLVRPPYCPSRPSHRGSVAECCVPPVCNTPLAVDALRWGGHGAQEVDNPPGTAVQGVTTLTECQAACARAPSHGCEAVLFSQDRRCYRKRHIDLHHCSGDAKFDLYVRTDPLPASAAVPLIIDTDLGFDVDDALAICMAHALHNAGEAKLLAVLHNSGFPGGIGGASVVARR